MDGKAQRPKPKGQSSGEDTTVAALWQQGKEQLANAGVERPELDAEILLREALGLSRASFFAHLRELVDNVTIEAYEAMLIKRSENTPVQYILGRQEFMGLEFTLTPDVLIPRPETEILVELVMERLKIVPRPSSLVPRAEGEEQGRSVDAGSLVPTSGLQEPISPDKERELDIDFTSGMTHPTRGEGLGTRDSARDIYLADLGTGSGAIAVSLAKYLSGAQVIAVDISNKALAIAQSNAMKHKVTDQISFLRGDFLQPLLETNPDQRLHAIVSNPPYIPTGVIPTLDGHVQSEPHLALDGGPDGLIFYRRLARDAAELLRPEGFVAVEVGDGQADAVAELFNVQGWQGTEIHPDLAGIPRVVIAYRPDE